VAPVLEDNPYAVELIKLKDIAVLGTLFEGAVYPGRAWVESGRV
jgi:hypothetical protein